MDVSKFSQGNQNQSSVRGGFAALALLCAVYFAGPPVVKFCDNLAKNTKKGIYDMLTNIQGTEIKKVKDGVFTFGNYPYEYRIVEDVVENNPEKGCMSVDCFLFRHNPGYARSSNEFSVAQSLMAKLNNGSGPYQTGNKVRVPVMVKPAAK